MSLNREPRDAIQRSVERGERISRSESSRGSDPIQLEFEWMNRTQQLVPQQAFFVTSELAELLRCTPRMICKMLTEDKLYGVKLGRDWKVPRWAVLDALKVAREQTFA